MGCLSVMSCLGGVEGRRHDPVHGSREAGDGFSQVDLTRQVVACDQRQGMVHLKGHCCLLLVGEQ